MVLDVCRQIVGDPHHAEDAFQAVFLVLARKARSIGNPDLLNNWLYGVTLRTAWKAKARLTRQRRYEEAGDPRPLGREPSRVIEQPALDHDDVKVAP